MCALNLNKAVRKRTQRTPRRRLLCWPLCGAHELWAQGREASCRGGGAPPVWDTRLLQPHAQRLLLQVQPPPQGQEVVTQVLHLPDQLSHGHLQGLALLSELRGPGLSVPPAWKGGPASPPLAWRPHQLQGAVHLLLGQLAGQLHGLQVLLQVGGQLPSPAVLQLPLGIPGGGCHRETDSAKADPHLGHWTRATGIRAFQEAPGTR